MKYFLIVFFLLFVGCKDQEQISPLTDEVGVETETPLEENDPIMQEFLEAGYEQACTPPLSTKYTLEGPSEPISQYSPQTEAIDYVLKQDARTFIKNICDTGKEFISCFRVTDRHYKGCGHAWIENIKKFMNDPSDANTVHRPLLGTLDKPLLDHVVKTLGFNSIEELQNTLPEEKDIENYIYIYGTEPSTNLSASFPKDIDEDTEILKIVKCFSQAFSCQ